MAREFRYENLSGSDSIGRHDALRLGSASANRRGADRPKQGALPKDAAPRQVPATGTTLLDKAKLPSWALSIVPQENADKAVWLYKNEDYALSVVVNRAGIVDAIIIAGDKANDGAATLLKTSNGTVKLGDDLRKVVNRFNYPSDIVPLATKPAPKALTPNGPNLNDEFRTYSMRYQGSQNHPSFDVTIRKNRVVRIFIF